MDEHQIKVLILTTLADTPGPVPRSLIETVMARCDANIFLIQLALSDLIENDNLLQREDDDGTRYLFLTDRGEMISRELRRDLPSYVIKHSDAYAQEEMLKLRRQVGVSADVTEITKGKQIFYECRMELKDDDLSLMRLNFFAPTRTQARNIQDRFKKAPLDVYRAILRTLTETDQEKKDGE